MKKLVVMVTALVLLCCIFCIPAYASEPTEDVQLAIKEMARQNTKVKDVACVVFGTTCGVAIRADNLYFQEDRNSLKSTLIASIKEKFPHFEEIYIKLDLDIFLKTKAIEKGLQEGKSIYSLKSEIMQVLRLSKVRD